MNEPMFTETNPEPGTPEVPQTPTEPTEVPAPGLTIEQVQEQISLSNVPFQGQITTLQEENAGLKAQLSLQSQTPEVEVDADEWTNKFVNDRQQVGWTS